MIILGLSLFVGTVWAAEYTLLTAPYAPQKSMMNWWSPIQHHLAEAQVIDIEIRRAADFPAFISDTATMKADFFLTPPHLAALMIARYGLQPILSLDFNRSYVILTKLSSGLDSVEQLNQKCIAFPHEIAYLSIASKRFLSSVGLDVFKGYRAIHLSNNRDVIMQVLRGRCDAAVAVGWMYERLSPAFKEALFKVADFEGPSTAHILVKSGIDSFIIDGFIASIKTFGYTENTKKYLKQHNYSPFIDFDESSTPQLIKQSEEFFQTLEAYINIEVVNP